MRHFKNMSLKNNNTNNTHPKHIFLDVNGAIETFFSNYHITNEEEFEHATICDDEIRKYGLINKQLVKYLLDNKNYLEDFIMIEDDTGAISELFKDNIASEEVIKSIINNYYSDTSLLVCE